MKRPVYIATVSLERNRWGSRQPSFAVSDWLPRFAADGFDGVELWENHFLAADAAEQERLVAAAAPVAIFNSYVGFADADAAARERAAVAIAYLSARAVKYNVGAEATRLAEYRRNLLAWADRLPPGCRLLCECHPGTVLERVADAAAFFADLDPERFAIIVHVAGALDGVGDWFSSFGPRVRHLHMQLRGAETDPAVPANRDRMAGCYDWIRAQGYDGSASFEFTRGIGRQEQIEALYANARADMAFWRERV